MSKVDRHMYCLLSLFQHIETLLSLIYVHFSHGNVTEYTLEEVVKVVGNASCQSSHSLQFLHTADLFFFNLQLHCGPFLLGNIPGSPVKPVIFRTVFINGTEAILPYPANSRIFADKSEFAYAILSRL